MVFKVTTKSKGSTSTPPKSPECILSTAASCQETNRFKDTLRCSYHKPQVVEFNPWNLGRTLF